MHKPDLVVDWRQVPLLKTYMPEHINAAHRCAMHPDLPQLRKQALKALTQAFDRIFFPAGYTRKQGTWGRGPGLDERGAAQHDPGGMATSFGQFWRRLRRSTPMRKNDGTVYLNLQKSKCGTGFFINAAIRNVHVPLAELKRDHVWSGSSTPDGEFRAFRLSRFLPELPPTHKLDEFAYVRLVEDPRLLEFLLHVVEKRIFPWLNMYADPATSPYPPLSPTAMARAGALPYGIKD